MELEMKGTELLGRTVLELATNRKYKVTWIDLGGFATLERKYINGKLKPMIETLYDNPIAIARMRACDKDPIILKQGWELVEDKPIEPDYEIC